MVAYFSGVFSILLILNNSYAFTHQTIRRRSTRGKSITVLSSPDDASTDAYLLRILRTAEDMSISKKAVQRVGCALFDSCSNPIESLVQVSNIFIGHSGVHAELNALVRYLLECSNDYLNSIASSNTPSVGKSDGSESLLMVVTYSPCRECAELIRLFPEIQEVQYEFAYDELGIQILTDASIRHRRLNSDRNMPPKRKQHNYALSQWEKTVTSIKIYEGISGQPFSFDSKSMVAEFTSETAFDCRVPVIEYLRLRKRSLASTNNWEGETVGKKEAEGTGGGSRTLTVVHRGQLNHREALFLTVCGIKTVEIIDNEH